MTEEFDGVMGHVLKRETLDSFYNETIKEYKFGFKRDAIWFHILYGSFMAITAVINHWIGLPKGKKQRMLHKYSGYCYIGSCIATAMSPGMYNKLLKYHFSFNIAVAEFLVLMVTTFFAVKGFLEIRAGKVKQHKISMIMSAAGPFSIFVQRPMLLLVCQNIKDPDPTDLYFREVPGALCGWLATVLTYSVAIWRAFYVQDVEPKGKRNKTE